MDQSQSEPNRQDKENRRRHRKKNKKHKNFIRFPETVDQDAAEACEVLTEESDLTECPDDLEVLVDENNEDFDSIVSTDGMMKAPPVIFEPEDENDLINKLEKVESELEDLQSQIQEEVVINKRALSKNAETYELEKFKKNALLIFNQENVDGYKPRFGTEKDVKYLRDTFENFGFEVTERRDFTRDEIFEELKTFSNTNFTDYGCVAIAVLTHGASNGLLWAKDQQYSEVSIINHFQVHDKPTLVTKPKILIIQACRGTKMNEAIRVLQAGKISKDHVEELEEEPYFLPAMSDILVIHSSYVGNPSYRDEIHGSWFIQSLCTKINNLYTTHDFESILTEVKRWVAIDKEHLTLNRRTSYVDNGESTIDVHKQMPVATSTLIRKLFLRKFGDEAPTVSSADSVVTSSKTEVLDACMPQTPQSQFETCSCFLDHFEYMRDCLSYFVEENPHDVTAVGLLKIATDIMDKVDFNPVKESTLRAICDYLIKHSRDYTYYKYLHFYRK